MNPTQADSLKVSVIICTKNVEENIRETLDTVFLNNPLEVILVDGKSTDSTLQIAEEYDDIQIYSDEGLGLSFARRIGVEKAEGKYILYVGPDNSLPKDFINRLVRAFESSDYSAASVTTKVKDPLNYWDRGLDVHRNLLLGKPGYIKVAGTPSIYIKELLLKYNFPKENIGPNDDTLVAKKLIESGYKIGLLPIPVFDKNGSTMISTWKRFRWYGEGDYYFYKKCYSKWTIWRRVQSLIHPLRQAIKHSSMIIFSSKFLYIFWLFFVTVARYNGWVKTYLKMK